MTSHVTGVLRLLLVLIFAGALLGQVLVPVIAHSYGQEYWEVEPLVVPYAAAGIAALVCFEVAIVAVWVLLGLVASGEVFTGRALRWVDAIIASGALAAALCAGVGAHLTMVAGIGGPPALLLLLGSLVGGAAFVLLMIVMRGLLETATADRRELTEVI